MATEAEQSPQTVALTYEELAKAIMQAKGIHEGIWMVRIQFTMVGLNAGPSSTEVNPSVLVSVGSVGLMRTSSLEPLCFDAADLNPLVSPKDEKPKPRKPRPKKSSESSSNV